MNRKATKQFIWIIGGGSTLIAFFGTLITDTLKNAILMAVFVAALIGAVGWIGLEMFWKERKR